VWEKDHLPNLTGTLEAWRPTGSISRTGERPRATGDYQAWTPD
jgi:NADH:ubiquinone oxidoreductase subunit